jgi:citrate lyase subunit beta / citryl-CoA lyase
MSSWSPGPAWLFCPADRPERYPKALAAADIVLVDLEDAVAPTRRDQARQALEHLASAQALDLNRTVVRINSEPSEQAADLATLAKIGIRRVMLAKSEVVAEVEVLPYEVVLLLETPRGIALAETLVAQPNVIGVMWGAEDLIAGLGGTSSRWTNGPRQGQFREVAQYARSRALIAAKCHHRLALDAVHLDLGDLAGLEVECADAVSVGFDATVAIHPQQIPVIRKAYTPSPEQLAWAQRLLAQVGNGGGVSTFEGIMVDGPVIAQAHRVLSRAVSHELQVGQK